MVVEANVEVNKVNYATKRELVHDIAISDEGKISEVLTYTLKIQYRIHRPGVWEQGVRFVPTNSVTNRCHRTRFS